MTPVSRVTVLYEDERGPTKGFGLHALVRMCVFDRLNGERFRVERALDGRPMKGYAKLLSTCRQDVADIARDGRAVVAVFDTDRVRRLVGLPHDVTDLQVERAIKTGCTAPDALKIILLERNTETVLAAAGECAPSLDRDQLARAVQGKNRSDRDAIFLAAAREPMRPLRDCILLKVPSLRSLIDHICKRLSPAPSKTKPT